MPQSSSHAKPCVDPHSPSPRPGTLTPEEFARGLVKLERDAAVSQNLLYGRAEGETAGAGAILRDILDRRDILARVFGGGAGPNPREVSAGASTAGLEAVPPGTLHQKTTLGANGTVLTPTVNTFLTGGPQRGGKLVGRLMPDGMVVGPDGGVLGRRNPKSGAVTVALAGEILHASTTVWPGVDGGGTTVGADGQYLGRKMPDGSVVGPTGIVIGVLDEGPLVESGLLLAAQLGSPASSAGPAGCWVGLRTQEECPHDADRHEEPWCPLGPLPAHATSLRLLRSKLPGERRGPVDHDELCARGQAHTRSRPVQRRRRPAQRVRRDGRTRPRPAGDAADARQAAEGR